MNHTQWFAQLKQGLVDKLLLFHGQEEYVKESALQQLKNALVSDAIDFNYQAFDSSDGKLDPQAIIAACETLPFMASRRLVVVRDSGWLRGKEEAPDMAAYLPNVPSTTCLLFYERGDADKRKKLYKAIQTNGTDVVFDILDPPERVRWLTREVGRAGKTIHPQAAQQLSERTASMTELAGRLEQVVAHAGDMINVVDVDALVPATLEDNVFHMVEQMSQGQHAQALASLRMLVQGGKEIIPLIATIARQYRQLSLAKGYMEKNTPVQKWASALGIPSFVAERMTRTLPRVKAETLHEAVQCCLEADLSIKTGRMRDTVALEWLVLKIISL